MARFIVGADGSLIPAEEYVRPTANKAAHVWRDIPGYRSPIDGRWIEGRVARREDMARSGSVDPDFRKVRTTTDPARAAKYGLKLER